MTDDHIDAFIRESEENIVDLNNSLLDLEDDPTDREAMDLIFRTAHTLKGNFSAMGFEDASRLAHAIEDLLDEIRESRMEVTPEVMDLIFDGVDLIEAILEDIEAEGESDVDPDPTIEAIRGAIEGDEPTDATGDDGTGDADDPAAIDPLAPLDDPSVLDATDGPAFHARVELGESEMKGVDGMLFLESASESLDLLETVPEPAAIQDGEYRSPIDVYVAGADGIDAAADAVEGIEQVETATVTAVADPDGAESAEDPGGGSAGADRGDAETDEGRDAPGGGARKEGADDIKSVRVDVEQLDELYNLVEQLVTSRIKLRRTVEATDGVSSSDTLDELDKITSSLQDTVMDMRLIPLKKVVNTFPRLVRDIAREQDKEIDFEMEGTDVELDRTILDEISDPLMHVLRNAADHGIEPPDVREEKGKPREGTIRLRAARERDHVTITIEDDGAGLDVESIREKAIEEGIHTESELDAMEAREIYELIFHPGFSTTEEVTDVSGRGVGMDVVHSTVSRLDGSVSVDSEVDEGTTITLRLPVTVAIVRVLFVTVGDREYGIPIKNIDEITPMNGVKTVNGDEVISHDDEIYPVIRLREALADAPADDGDGMLLRIRESERKVALRCDEVHRQEEVVIKPLEGDLSNTPGLSGTAVIGDGNVVPILDVGTLRA